MHAGLIVRLACVRPPRPASLLHSHSSSAGSSALQAKLLQALETKQIEPLGTFRPVTVDVRIIAGTNRDLRTLVEAGQFRDADRPG